MPLAIIALHMLLICGAIALLTLICSTGNFWNLPGAGTWIALDLMVSIVGVAFSASPDYAHLIPRLALFHFAAMVVCLSWMGLDNLREVSTLSGVFFWAFLGYGCLRAAQAYAFRFRLLPPFALELVNATAYLMVVGVLIAALMLRVPPESAPVEPVYSPFVAAPMPPVAALAAAEVAR